MKSAKPYSAATWVDVEMVKNDCIEHVNQVLKSRSIMSDLVVSIPQKILPNDYKNDVIYRLLFHYEAVGADVRLEDGCLAFKKPSDVFITTRRYNAGGALHCETGPAIEWSDGTQEWYTSGVRYKVADPEGKPLSPDQLHNFLNSPTSRENFCDPSGNYLDDDLPLEEEGQEWWDECDKILFDAMTMQR